MSTLVRKRKKPTLNFLILSRDLEIMTIRMLNDDSFIPKKFRFTLGERLINLACDCHEYVRKANVLYPHSVEDYELRARYQRLAETAAEGLISQIDVTSACFNIKSSKLETWSKLAVNTKHTIRAWRNKDIERFEPVFYNE